jgi:tRNA (guanine37-N1)-methyltransferase
MMQVGIITLFPEIFDALNYGVVGRAIERELVKITHFNPRAFAQDKHHHVDDRPYGGGPGMVMLPEPLVACIEHAKTIMPADTKLVYLSPQGRQFNQTIATNTAQSSSLLLLCGRYEGIDERVIAEYVDVEWSIGDYVLSGGEFAALTVIDAIVRLIPGVLGHQDSAAEDSFSEGLLDCPHYTRPEVFHDQAVPPVLLSGNHADIATWRMQQSLGRTWERRPDLLEQLQLTKKQQNLLDEYIQQVRGSKK